MGSYARRRGADHRPRRGRLRLRRARQPLPRRALGAVLRQRRPRPHRARRGRRRARSRSSTSTSSGATRTRARSSSPSGSPSLAPGDLNRVFFTSGGSEAVESAIKLARAYHQRTGNPRKIKFLTREIAYHGTTLGRPAGDRDPGAAHRLRAPGPGRDQGAEHEQLPLARGPRPALGRRPDRGEDPLRGPGDGRRGDPRAAAERRRLHPAAGRLLPARARDLRPPRRAAGLRRGDLRLGPARPLLRLRALRLPARHHHHARRR